MFEVWEKESIIPVELYESKPVIMETVQKALAYYSRGGYYSAEEVTGFKDRSPQEDALPYMRTCVNGEKVFAASWLSIQ